MPSHHDASMYGTRLGIVMQRVLTLVPRKASPHANASDGYETPSTSCVQGSF